MLSRRWAKYVALLLLVGMLIPTGLALSGQDSGPSADDVARQQATAERQRCVGFATSVVGQLQAYVARFDAPAGSADATPPGIPSIDRLRDQVGEVSAKAESDGCDPAVFRAALARKIRALRATSDLGSAVAGALVANVRDVLDPGSPRRVEVAPGDDLAAAFQGVPQGSTVVLAAGTYRVDRPLVVLQDVTVVGAGRDRTRIVSTAADAALLQAAPVRLVLRDLEVRHAGAKTASVLLLRAGSTRLDRVAVTGAALAPGAGSSSGAVPDLASGGNGVVALSSGSTVLRDVHLTGNEAGGIVASGRARPRLGGATVTGNRLCGACFLGRSAGEVRGGTIRGNGVGLVVANRAHPRVVDVTVSANRRAGLVSQQDAAPVVSGSRFAANGDIGFAVYNRSDAVLRDSTVTGHRQVGVVVSAGAGAAPRIEGNVLRGNAHAGVAFLGASRGVARGNTCSGGAAGLVIGGTAQPRVTGSGCPVRDERTG